ncbi:MAG: 4Fe-4S dicluster domain-containing protein [Actinomycetota bacterium]|jgi:formate dehydrogenase iron-sulfur subunit|nr:4Fe-4S dicluster domain-containing protein [Actinomycetota bacterium]
MDPAAASGYLDPPARVGFFTDTSICIGCKACEVACKEWNGVPEDGLQLTGMSYDNTGGLSADTWRHVAFIEQRVPIGVNRPDASAAASAGGAAAAGGDRGAGEAQGAVPIEGQRTVPAEAQGAAPVVAQPGLRWLMASDVCKHCTRAACLDVCPTGALFRTEFGTVVVQQDVCNGCGYCIPACPFGVIGQRSGDGRAWKCTLCYDRLTVGMEPACAKACPTQSIQFGVLDELRERADRRLVDLHRAGVSDARLYGRNPADGVGGGGAFMLLLDEPEVYGLPPDPVVTTADLAAMWRRVALAATALAAAGVAAFAGRRR